MQQSILYMWYLLFLFATFCNGLRYRRDYYDDLFNVGESSYFTQQLDHFDNANKNTWSQRYFENGNFYENDGPVFVMIDGESEAHVDWYSEEPWLVWAGEFHAQCYALEHRYYGMSQPTDVENLQYLSTEQALADIANFQLQMIANNPNLGGLTKWVYFGGSYAGNLVAWFRLKYPHLAYAGVASSAPVLHVVESSELLKLVYEAFYNHNPVCSQAIEKALIQVQNCIDGDDSDRLYLSYTLNFCKTEESYEAIQVTHIYNQINIALTRIVQYDSPGTSTGIEEACNIMMDPSTSELNRLATIINSNFYCFPKSYKAEVEAFQGMYYEMRPWIYQLCTEVGDFTTTSKLKRTEGTVSLKFYTDLCGDIFGSQFNKKLVSFGVSQTNTNYGGKNISVTRVIFINGSLDPWRCNGILQDISSEAKAVYIQGTSHCADMRPISSSDSPELVEAREIIRQQIHSWVYEY